MWVKIPLLNNTHKILSKCIANRLKKTPDSLIHDDQTYCIPKRCIYDHLFLMRDLLEYLRMYNVNLGILSLDQEKAFDRIDHLYLFHVLKCFGDKLI